MFISSNDPPPCKRELNRSGITVHNKDRHKSYVFSPRTDTPIFSADLYFYAGTVSRDSICISLEVLGNMLSIMEDIKHKT